MATAQKQDKKIVLYSLATPNGQKIGIMLEELKLPYEAHTIDIKNGEQFTEEFKKVNPNSKIPAIVDPDGPDGKPFAVFESGAILWYLAEKTGKLLPKDPRKRYEVLQWLFWQMSGLGPMFGQLGHFFRYAPEKIQYAIDRYSTEARRLLAVLDKQLAGCEYIVGEYSIADIACIGWVNAVDSYAHDMLKMDEFQNVMAWKKRLLERPAVQEGMKVCPFPKT